MNLDDLSTQLLFTTFPIWTEDLDGNVSSATCFIYSVPSPNDPNKSVPFLVTNYHVVKRARRVVVEFVEGQDNKPTLNKRIRVEISNNSFMNRKSEDLDIVAVPLSSLINQLRGEGKSFYYKAVSSGIIPSREALNELSAIEEIVFLGYPSGLRDAKNASPIIRRGITATPVWNDFQDRPSFLIDAAVFPGSSGSPVFIVNQGSYSTKNNLVIGSRLIFLGIITDTVIKATNSESVYLGLGKVIRSIELSMFINSVLLNA